MGRSSPEKGRGNRRQLQIDTTENRRKTVISQILQSGSFALLRTAVGQALIREGKVTEGMASLKAAIAHYEAIGGKTRAPILKAFLAEAMALTGDLDNALKV